MCDTDSRSCRVVVVVVEGGVVVQRVVVCSCFVCRQVYKGERWHILVRVHDDDDDGQR